jgi:cytochrome c5
MKHRGYVRLAAAVACLLGAVAERSQAQKAPGDSNGARSTMSGIFTTAQAARGEDTYMSICVGCHPAGTYTGSGFAASWGNRPLSELFSLIKETMPKVDPGTLSEQEIAQVIAYILKSNRVPAGKSELPTDVETLRNIRIELPSMRRGK